MWPPALAFWFWVLWLSENGGVDGQAPPLPSLSTVKLLDGVFAPVPLKGVREVVVMAVPHTSGLATGASAPSFKCRVTLVNGCSGFSENTAVSWPVASLGMTSPLRRTDTPYLADSASR